MNIDWFTFAAQLVNFLILVALLHRFLYGPIVEAMQQREDRITERLREAESQLQAGNEKAERYDAKLVEMERQREQLLRDARHEADGHKNRLMVKARDEVQHKRTEWFHTFRHERAELLREMQKRIGHLTVKATRQTLSNLADEELEQRLFASFLNRIKDLGSEERANLKAYLESSNVHEDVMVRSSFPVSDVWKERFTEVVSDMFGYSGDIDFDVREELVCGIEFEASGYSLGWNVNEFLRTLESGFEEQLETQSQVAS